MATHPSVLVVDDSADGREMLIEYLQFRGFQVCEARDGADAIAVARRVRPAIVLMDLSMPRVDGWEATRRLRADPLTKASFIVALTAHAFEREQNAAREAGCDAVVPKPFDLTALADALMAVPTQGVRAFTGRALATKGDARGRKKR